MELTKRTGRTATKASPRLFKLRKDLDKFLLKESRRTGRPMVDIVEDGLEYLKTFKPSAQ